MMIKVIKQPSKEDWQEIVKRPVFENASLEKTVKKILDKVKGKGDKALRKYTKDFDGVKLKKLAVSEKEIKVAENLLSQELKDAIQQAKSNIEKFHRSQIEETKVIETMPGINCWRKSVGIEKVGIYIPGGTAPLFSTVLMLAIPAVPSEVLVIADETAVPEFVAADLLSQAEHGADSQVILLTTSKEVAENVQICIKEQLKELPRKEIAEKALANSKIILLNSIDEAIDLSNLYAPEHLILSCNNAEELTGKIISAGSVFIGNYSPESVGDYASGTNHTLPTNGYAAMYSGVSVDSFAKRVTFQQLTKDGLTNIGNTVMQMAEAEGLDAHKNAVAIRLKEQ